MCVCAHAHLVHLFNRLKGKEKHKRWLSCQRRCDAAREQLSSWQRRGEQMNRKCCAAEEEVTWLREALEKVQQETRQLRRERSWLWCISSALFTSTFFSNQSSSLPDSVLFYYYMFINILFIRFWFFSLPKRWRNKSWTSKCVWWSFSSSNRLGHKPILLKGPENLFLNQLLTVCDRVIHFVFGLFTWEISVFLLFLCWFESETEDSWWVV